MISIREVQRQYKQLIDNLKNNKYINSEVNNTVNCYKCSVCGHIIKTVDINQGVTPFLYTCDKCGGSACSTMYQDIAPEKEPEIEWYRPTIKQCIKMRSKHQDTLMHVLQGGLLDRRIIKK